MVEPVRTVALVNSFNRAELLKEALGSLMPALSELPEGAAIVVFDAGSKDESREYLLNAANQSPVPIQLIFANPGEDTSFSAGLNRAAQIAIEGYPQLDRFLFFETDNWISGAEPLQKAIAVLEGQPKLAAVGFTVHKHSGEPAGYGEAFPTINSFVLGPHLSHFLHHRKGQEPITDWVLCDIVYTSPLLVRRKAWEESRGMDAEAFPFSDCDLDWAWRLNKLGWQMAVLATNDVVHDNREQLSSWSRLRVISWHRARLKLLCRHRGLKAPCVRPLLFARHIMEIVALLLIPGQKDRRGSLDKRVALLRTVFNDYDMTHLDQEAII